MTEYSKNISTNTWARAVDSVCKVGYMDGAADGQSAIFQSSFDKGYDQGLSFGWQLGYNEALNSIQQHRAVSSEPRFTDARSINCQICLNNATAQENIEYLYGQQKKKNDEYLQINK